MLQLNGIDWKVSELGNQALLLEPITKVGQLERIHYLYKQLENSDHTLITDIVPAYKSIALFYSSSSKEELLEFLSQANLPTVDLNNSKVIEVEVNYEEGMDWSRVCEITGFSKSEIIERHTSTTYNVAMIGFLPGFIFLDGLATELSIPRLETPRTHIPAGSIGIGGNQTGIYSLESPGGWNIIGKTIRQFFDINTNPPISISPGDKLKFKSVNE